MHAFIIQWHLHLRSHAYIVTFESAWWPGILAPGHLQQPGWDWPVGLTTRHARNGHIVSDWQDSRATKVRSLKQSTPFRWYDCPVRHTINGFYQPTYTTGVSKYPTHNRLDALEYINTLFSAMHFGGKRWEDEENEPHWFTGWLHCPTRIDCSTVPPRRCPYCAVLCT